MSGHVIDYADRVTASGISYLPTEHGCEIVFPVGLTRRGRATFLGDFGGELASFGLAVGVLVCFLNVWVGLAIVVTALLAFLLILWIDNLLVARAPRARITLSETDLTIAIPGAPGTHDLDWLAPRDRVHDVKFVSHSGNLIVRAYGHEMFDEHVHDDPRVTEWIAQSLRRHLGMNPS